MLFRSGGEETKVGDPVVAGATVEASVVEDGKDKKVIVYKYKRKTGYHKKQGHRQPYTKVKIEKINAYLRLSEQNRRDSLLNKNW